MDDMPGFHAPVHRALTEPILLGGAPRALAIVNGTLAGAVRDRAMGDRPCAIGLRGAARSAVRRCGAPAPALSILGT
jgi:type IV secretory pathway TrbD component